MKALSFAKKLLAYYHATPRPMPWRGEVDPYKIWLSEIMLQQTTVQTVVPYYQQFIKQFPTVFDLAKADEQTVLHHWQGLGYYSRARNLLKCARVVVAEHKGIFPTTADALQTLPGIGPYTSAAIAAIAFNKPIAAVDGNVERVVSRIFAITTPLPAAKPVLKELAQTLVPQKNAGDFAQAMMDLGATICTPKKPRCTTCPVSLFCEGYKMGIAETLPRKTAAKKLPRKSGVAYVVHDKNGRIFLRQRASNGLLANLWEVPHTGFKAAPLPAFVSEPNAKVLGHITHTFTHFHLTLEVKKITLRKTQPDWFTPENFPPLPTLMRKVLQLAV